MKRYILLLLAFCCFMLPLPVAFAEATHDQFVQQKEAVVYITKTGEKYHKESCRYLSKSSIKVSRKEALKNGYTACKVCKP